MPRTQAKTQGTLPATLPERSGLEQILSQPSPGRVNLKRPSLPRYNDDPAKPLQTRIRHIALRFMYELKGTASLAEITADASRKLKVEVGIEEARIVMDRMVGSDKLLFRDGDSYGVNHGAHKTIHVLFNPKKERTNFELRPNVAIQDQIPVSNGNGVHVNTKPPVEESSSDVEYGIGAKSMRERLGVDFLRRSGLSADAIDKAEEIMRGRDIARLAKDKDTLESAIRLPYNIDNTVERAIVEVLSTIPKNKVMQMPSIVDAVQKKMPSVSEEEVAANMCDLYMRYEASVILRKPIGRGYDAYKLNPKFLQAQERRLVAAARS